MSQPINVVCFVMVVGFVFFVLVSGVLVVVTLDIVVAVFD